MLEYLNLSANKLSVELGHDNNTKIYHVKNGRNKISADLAKQISDKYSISVSWLLTGEGPMLKDETKNYNLEEVNNIKVKESSEVFKTKAGSIYTENSDGSYTITVPLVPFEAYASYVEVYNDEVALVEEWEKVSFNVDKIGLGKYLGFKSKGDSMNGGSLFDTPDKALILAREIGRHHWLDGFWHSDYGFILVTKFSMMHKDIIDFNKDKGEITCHSRNESPEYSDFNLNLNDVYQIFRVIKRTF